MEFEILIIDDKIADADAVAEILSELADVKTTTYDNHEKALLLVERDPSRFPLILIDFNLNIKALDGLALAKKIWQLNPEQLIAIFSGETNLEAPIKCIGTPIVEFITKGGPATLTQKKVQNLLKKYAATHQPKNLTKILQDNQNICTRAGIVAKSSVMADLVKSMIKVSAHDAATVLIRGDSYRQRISRARHS